MEDGFEGQRLSRAHQFPKPLPHLTILHDEHRPEFSRSRRVFLSARPHDHTYRRIALTCPCDKRKAAAGRVHALVLTHADVDKQQVKAAWRERGSSANDAGMELNGKACFTQDPHRKDTKGFTVFEEQRAMHARCVAERRGGR